MFTGIIETLGEVKAVTKKDDNLILRIYASFMDELRVDQSIAHNGVCLTVTGITEEGYEVVVIRESQERSNLGALKVGDRINLERCMVANARFDGHIVQGHVDQVAVCKSINEEGGSWKFWFTYDPAQNNITVEKGSITINGVSLTVVDSQDGAFSVAIIPYTYEHTNFASLKVGDTVNLEFDIIGKYVQRILQKINLLLLPA